MTQADQQWPLVVIVTLNYKSHVDTERCLRSLRTVDYPALKMVVVDNASGDEGPDRIDEQFPEVVLLRMNDNLGFSGGNNKGIEYALEHGAECVMLLNNDTEIREVGFLKRMVEVLRANPDIGILAPRILNGHAGGEQDTLLTYPFLKLRQRFTRLRNEPKPRSGGLWSVYGAAAVCWLMPTAAIREVGLMDDSVFMYGEDNDYCWRMHQAGRAVVLYDLHAIIHYFTSMTNPSMSSLRSQMYYVNKLYFLHKHGGTFTYGVAHLAAFAYRALRHLLSYKPRKEVGRELRSCGRVLGGMIRQLAKWGRGVEPSPDPR
jgi:GT2 family glycosyltransferase